MRFVKRHPFAVAAMMGLLIRLSLLFLDFGWDVNNHLVWAKDLWARGPAGFYDTPSSEVYASLYPNYPPLALFLFYLIYPLKWLIFELFWRINLAVPLFPSVLVLAVKSRAFEAGLLKLPALLSDLALAWLIYRFARKLATKNQKIGLAVSAGILFNPAFFYNSSYWGQIDVIPIFLALSAAYLLFFSTRHLLSGALFTLAVLVKPTALVYLPVYAVFFLQKFGPIRFIKTFIAANLIFWVAFLPFAKSLDDFWFPYQIYAGKILAAQSLPFVTNGAFNFWVLVTGFEGIGDTTPFLFGFSYRVWAMMITSVFFLFIILSARRLKNKVDAFAWALFLSALAAFLFLTKMHERYLILTLPALLIAVIKNKRLWKWFSVFSLASFVNLYHSWPAPRIEFAALALSHPLVYTGLSLVNVILFLCLLRRISFQKI